MRCIEIAIAELQSPAVAVININMRCIEMRGRKQYRTAGQD